MRIEALLMLGIDIISTLCSLMVLNRLKYRSPLIILIKLGHQLAIALDIGLFLIHRLLRTLTQDSLSFAPLPLRSYLLLITFLLIILLSIFHIILLLLRHFHHLQAKLAALGSSRPRSFLVGVIFGSSRADRFLFCCRFSP